MTNIHHALYLRLVIKSNHYLKTVRVVLEGAANAQSQMELFMLGAPRRHLASKPKSTKNTS